MGRSHRLAAFFALPLAFCWVAPIYGRVLRPRKSRGVKALARGDGLPEVAEDLGSRREVVTDWAQGLLQLAGSLAAFAAAFYVGAKVVLLGQPRMPALRGPYQTIGSRLLRLANLRCRLLYPADPAALGAPEAPYLSEGKKTSDAMAGLVFFPGFLLEHLADAGSGCVQDAPPLLSDTGYPILVYSHGQGGNMDMGTYFLRQIASYGLIVVAVEHQDGSASTGDEANPRPFSLTRGQLGVNYRAEELVQVTRALLSENLAEELGGQRQNVLVGGHSYGGPTAILAAAKAPDFFSGLVLHDPAVSSEMPSLRQPVFSIVGDEYVGIEKLVRVVRKVSASGEARPWSGAWHFAGISHGNFVDAPLWGPLLVMQLLSRLLIPAAGPFDPAQAHNAMAEAAADFATGQRRAVQSDQWQRL
ncbi:unnamed protein product [Effrenium voratum]|uniref:1-alkyl-2-acetylglycerophosphocholine esterase n=1 Tax=Effrenium voratum TaxID=2562239 RepID=A0AA36HWV1_9DINO|nr:unnamed protein product [Effrenium voratum]CAJ1414352.1 unnamed protein product [Effrenium voratum]